MAFREIDDGLWEIVRNYLPPTKPHIGRPRCDPRGLFNGILYVLTTGCTWHDVPAKYGTKSTVHRYLLELCEKGVCQAIFLDLLRSGYEIRKTRKIRDFSALQIFNLLDWKYGGVCLKFIRSLRESSGMAFWEIDDELWKIVWNYLPSTKPYIS